MSDGPILESTSEFPSREVTYQFTAEEWKSLCRTLAGARGVAAPFLAALLMVAACSLPGTLVLFYWRHPSAWQISLGVFLLGGMLVLKGIKFSSPAAQYLRPTTISLSRQCIQARSDLSSTRRDWSQITGVEIRRGFLLLRSADRSMLVIPLRAFGAPEAAQAFAEAAVDYRAAAAANPRDGDRAAWPRSPGDADDEVSFVTSARAQQLLKNTLAPEPANLNPPPEPVAAKRTIRGELLLLPVALLTGLLLFERSRGVALTHSLVVGVVVVALGAVLTLVPVARLVAGLTQSRAPTKPESLHRVVISPQGLWIGSPGQETQDGWPMIDDVQQSAEALVFCSRRPSLVHLFAIPKSAFANEAAAKRFFEIAAGYCASAIREFPETTMPPPPPRIETGNPYQPPQSS